MRIEVSHVLEFSSGIYLWRSGGELKINYQSKNHNGTVEFEFSGLGHAHDTEEDWTRLSLMKIKQLRDSLNKNIEELEKKLEPVVEDEANELL